MAREYITGLLVHSGEMEWTTLRRGKDRHEREGTGKVSLAGLEPDGSQAKPEAPSAETESARQRVRSQCASMKGDVTAGLPSEKTLLRVVDLPDVSEEELESMVRLQVDKFSPFPIENMVVSHEILHRKEKTCTVVVAAAARDIVESLGKTLGSAGLAPVRIDAAALGRWRLLRDAGQIEAKGRHVVLLMDGPIPEVIVAQDGVPVVFRSLDDTGGLSEAEFAGEVARQVGYTLMSLELERGSGGTTSVAVWNRGKMPPLLPQRLKDECGCEAAVKSLESLPPPSEGIARRSADGPDGKLDLTPDAWRTSSLAVVFRKKMMMAAGIVACVWVLAMTGFFGGLYYQEKRLDYLKGKYQKLQKSAKEVSEMQRLIGILGRYADRSRSALECLREVVSCLPAGVRLNTFIYTKGTAVSLRGDAPDVNLIYAFKSELDGSKLFDKVALNAVSSDRSGKKVFGIEIKLPGGER